MTQVCTEQTEIRNLDMVFVMSPAVPACVSAHSAGGLLAEPGTPEDPGVLPVWLQCSSGWPRVFNSLLCLLPDFCLRFQHPHTCIHHSCTHTPLTMLICTLHISILYFIYFNERPLCENFIMVRLPFCCDFLRRVMHSPPGQHKVLASVVRLLKIRTRTNAQPGFSQKSD